MTTILSYVNSKFTVILTDNRINYGPKQEGGYEDGHNKLINLKDLGWASGAGFASYLDRLKESLSTSDISDTGDIKHIFNHILNEYKKDEPLYEKEIDKSVVVASWLGANKSNAFYRIGMLSNENFNTNIMLAKEGCINIVYPGDYLDDLSKVREIEEKNNFFIGEKELDKVLNAMFGIFKEISTKSRQVSSTCDIGIMVALESSFYKIKISGEIKELISELNSGLINNRIKIINVIN